MPVQRPGGLVGEQEVGALDQGPGDRAPLLLAARELRGELVPVLGQAQVLEVLKATGDDLDWFYLSPPAEFGAWVPSTETGEYRTSDDVLLRSPDGSSQISAADLALAVLDEIDQPRHPRRRFHVAH
ncbi:hypothetical protein PCC79_16630 [Propioniciclava soli]|uniref:Uncharacterized protein n=1 Tax=Propioniciclava soli TaxID=2775081 RepID=A0ABZ3C7H5_9ACTN